MRLFVSGEVHKNFAPVCVGNVVGKVLEKLMRAALEIHRNVQGIKIARFILNSSPEMWSVAVKAALDDKLGALQLGVLLHQLL